jgi:hypothetical protein
VRAALRQLVRDLAAMPLLPPVISAVRPEKSSVISFTSHSLE